MTPIDPSVLNRPSLPALGLCLLLLPGCGSRGTEPAPPAASAIESEPVHGGTAVLGSTSDVDSWNEYTSRQDFAGKLHRRIHLRLAQELGESGDAPQSFTPLLAQSWSFSDDGLVLTFRLREATWSDGVAIGADDVVFSWKAQTDEQVAWIGAASKARIERVEAVDRQTVAFRFTQRYPQQLADAVEGGILPEHVYGRVPFAQWRTHDWTGPSVGSGPFLLERYQPSQEIALERNPRYFREGYPRLDRVVIRIVPNANNLLTQLLAGEIDFYEGLAPQDAEPLRSNEDLALLPFNQPKYDYIGWNCGRPPFRNPQVRMALTYGIDRAALVEDLLFGYGRVSKGPLPSYTWGNNPKVDAWPYDPQAARTLLLESGYSVRNERGQTEGDGPVLEFELLTNSGNSLREGVLVQIRSQLERIGVKVNLRNVEMRTMIGMVLNAEYDAYLGGRTMPGTLDLKPIFASGSVPPQGSNVVFYNNPMVDQMLDVIERAPDWTSMKRTLDDVQWLIHRDQPYTFLYETQRLAIRRERLAGMEIDIPLDPLARLESAWVRPS